MFHRNDGSGARGNSSNTTMPTQSTFSVLERLVDEFPDSPIDNARTPWPSSPGEARLAAAIGRELSRLLNTRRARRELRAGSFSAASIVDYGVPDWSGDDPRSAADTQRLARDIEHAIRCFEPRLADPQVELAPQDDGPHCSLALRIRGCLRFPQAPMIAFLAQLSAHESVRLRSTGDESAGGANEHGARTSSP